ncbi:hypothetical protein PPERSA_03106 [Pseudocohnilembus persalinus]|uniref:START domain-containing protein n=1 Tax=Pseudocohnilembus persalinus TaxID=266149 RepID=A0A0V0QR25_PSEPJ|nr:hypothetical protein PPERSA_03106 [Pseudocohnilembus persalinus]|eukprot:KRX04715.1 hypothetical protein PPERSA_03106 [Pseudocohnilembus persalinus]
MGICHSKEQHHSYVKSERQNTSHLQGYRNSAISTKKTQKSAQFDTFVSENKDDQIYDRKQSYYIENESKNQNKNEDKNENENLKNDLEIQNEPQKNSTSEKKENDEIQLQNSKKTEKSPLNSQLQQEEQNQIQYQNQNQENDQEKNQEEEKYEDEEDFKELDSDELQEFKVPNEIVKKSVSMQFKSSDTIFYSFQESLADQIEIFKKIYSKNNQQTKKQESDQTVILNQNLQLQQKNTINNEKIEQNPNSQPETQVKIQFQVQQQDQALTIPENIQEQIKVQAVDQIEKQNQNTEIEIELKKSQKINEQNIETHNEIQNQYENQNEIQNQNENQKEIQNVQNENQNQKEIQKENENQIYEIQNVQNENQNEKNNLDTFHTNLNQNLIEKIQQESDLQLNKNLEFHSQKGNTVTHIYADNETGFITTRVQDQMKIKDLKDFASRVSELNHRLKVDPMLKDIKTLKKFDENTDITLQTYKGFPPIVKGREFVIFSKKNYFPQNQEAILVATTIDDVFEVEKSKGFTRGKCEIGGWILKKINQNQNQNIQEKENIKENLIQSEKLQENSNPKEKFKQNIYQSENLNEKKNLDSNFYDVIYISKVNPMGKIPMRIKKTTVSQAIDMMKKTKKIVENL